MTTVLDRIDPAVAAAIENEHRRQRDSIVLIASENYASKAVLDAQAQLMGNKYAEGYPGRRYYGGCEFVDVVETLAIDRAKELFGAEHANVQAHSGAQANMAAYFAVLETRRRRAGYAAGYGRPSDPRRQRQLLRPAVQLHSLRRGPGKPKPLTTTRWRGWRRKHRPKLIVAGCSSYSRTLDFPRFRAIADDVGALLMVDMAHISGLVAGGAHPSPLPHAQIVTSTTQKTLRGPRGGMILAEADLGRKIDFAVFPYMQGGPFMHVIAGKAVCFGEALRPDFADYARQVVANAQAMAAEIAAGGVRLVAGGTDNHLMLVDLTPLGITGRQAERALESVDIVANKNAIPYDTLPPRTASGLRLGTPAITSRGMDADDARQVAKLIIRALGSIDDEAAMSAVRDEVRQLSGRFPVPGLDDD